MGIFCKVFQNVQEIWFMLHTEQTHLSISFKPYVLLEIFHAHVLQRSSQLHPHTFNVVGGNSSGHVLVKLKSAETTLMTNGFVDITNVTQTHITLPFVRVDRGSGQNILHDEFVQGLLLSVRQDEEERLLRLVFP